MEHTISPIHERGIEPIHYPCRVVNRFQCPYGKTNMKNDDNSDVINPPFETEDLFRLQRMAFAIEISLAKARKKDSSIRVRNKEELLHALTDKKIFSKILEQGAEAGEVSEDIIIYLVENHDHISDYFLKIKDKVNLEDLRFY